MKQFLQLVIGTDNYPLYLAQWFFALVAMSLRFLWGVAKRNPIDPATPVHFSLNVLWSDNARKMYAALILIFLVMRFPAMLLPQLGITKFTQDDLNNTTYALVLAALVGFFSDWVAQRLKKWNFMGIGSTKEEDGNK